MKRRSGVKKRRTEHQATTYPIASWPAKSYGILGISLLPMKTKMADHLPDRVQPAKNGGIPGISEYAMKKSNYGNTNPECK